MHDDLFRLVVAFVNDAELRTFMGFDYERCIVYRVPPLKLDLTRFAKLHKTCQLRHRGHWHSHHFSLQLYRPSTRQTVLFGRNVDRRNGVIQFNFSVITNVELDEEEMLATTPVPKQSQYRQVTVRDGVAKAYSGRLNSTYCGFIAAVIE